MFSSTKQNLKPDYSQSGLSHLDRSINRILRAVESEDYKVSVGELSDRLDEEYSQVNRYFENAPEEFLEKGYGIENNRGEYRIWKI